ncbi:MAG TPA: hypothetical protein VFM94_01600 [Solirubrobacterales bacterium]|nr:hypothetical protein [Solirubrobacterales bacterium]
MERWLKHSSDAGKPSGKLSLELCGVGVLDSPGYVVERQHSKEIDVDGSPAGPAGILCGSSQKGGLAISTRGNEAGVMAALGVIE